MRFNTLQQWLSWQETLHCSEIELGLERIRTVYQRLYSVPFNIPVISIAGTNGKGSSVAMLASIYSQAGYRVGSYTSPHLLQYNERICINQQPVSDNAICDSFERIDKARLADVSSHISLTYFEFGTLAAFDIFHQAEAAGELDVVILEVGLGGRLDAVNLVDADIALITSIGLDHTDWLGDTRDVIGYEKAGIMRAGHPVVCSDPDLPQSIQAHADKLGAPLYKLGNEFQYEQGKLDWQWSGKDSIRSALPRPALIGEHQYQNAAGVLMVVELLSSQLPVSQAHVRQGLMEVGVTGRCQIIPGDQTVILDVAHNPDSVKSLAKTVQEMIKSNLAENKPTRVFALVGMMKDKALKESLQPMANLVKHWFIVKAPVERAAEPAELENIVHELNAESSVSKMDAATAFSQMQSQANKGDILIVFGSFYTVSAVLPGIISV